MKRIISMALALVLGVSLSYASDLALYIGHPNPDWYLENQMLQDAQKIVDAVKGLFKEVKTFNDDQLKDLQAWAEANLDDGELDIIWLPGTMPSVLYPNPNKQPDGSLAENWLDKGNMFINVADWFAYCTYETGARGADNGQAGAENILNLPGIIRFGDNTAMKRTPTGDKYLPSLPKDFRTDRPVVINAIKSPWEVAALFGSPGGSDDPAKEADADPIVIHNTKTDGYVAIINQAALDDALKRADLTIEFIKNWVAQVVKLTPVEPASKLPVTWGAIKAR